MARKKRKLAVPPGKLSAKSWAVCGFDTSLSSVAGACLIYDAVLGKLRGPGLFSIRWERDVHYFDRLGQIVRGHDIVWSLMGETAPLWLEPHQVFIAVEEPWPAGIVKKAESGWLRQQAQMQGAFMGGLVRAGWENVYEVNSQLWKRSIREDTGIGRPTKFDVKTWAIDAYGVPDLPDLIDHSTRGLIPRPEGSRAKSRQPDDKYDSVGICDWMRTERENLLK